MSGSGAMRVEDAPLDAAVPRSVTERRERWAGGWRRIVFPIVFLVYLGRTVVGIGHHATGVEAVAGYLALVAFAACYVAVVPRTMGPRDSRFWWLFGALVVMATVEVPIAHEDAFATFVFVGAVSVAALDRWAAPVVGSLAVVATVTPAVIPSWGRGLDADAGVSIAVVALAMYGFFTVARSNRDLLEARVEIARLASENERNRIARDLHDLLGHSLTAITVKAGLAARLAERDPARAAAEIGEVEDLARRSLVDVRAAVSNYRGVTLTTELASGRELLRAANIDLRAPAATDEVPAANRELFGWVVREALTNVVRHSNASWCAVSFGPGWIEVVDDGVGGDGNGDGSGLSGLRERVAAVGGTLAARARVPRGWCIRVDVPTTAAEMSG